MHVLVRLVQINVALWGHLLWWGLVRSGLRRPKTAPAQRFAAVLERLGTTFIKLGQGLSLHRELLPDDYVTALQKLHDRVEPFSGIVAQGEVKASFGRPVSEIFRQCCEVGRVALLLASQYTSAITGEIVHVDAGYHIEGMVFH